MWGKGHILQKHIQFAIMASFQKKENKKLSYISHWYFLFLKYEYQIYKKIPLMKLHSELKNKSIQWKK